VDMNETPCPSILPLPVPAPMSCQRKAELQMKTCMMITCGLNTMQSLQGTELVEHRRGTQWV
jgi:hypothetical protein